MTSHTRSILTLQDYAPKRILMADVLKVVVRFYHVSMDDLCGPRRLSFYMRARQATYFLSRKYAVRSYGHIGRKLNKNHASVIHGERRVRDNPDKYQPELSKCIAELESQCQLTSGSVGSVGDGGLRLSGPAIPNHSGARR